MNAGCKILPFQMPEAPELQSSTLISVLLGEIVLSQKRLRHDYYCYRQTDRHVIWEASSHLSVNFNDL